MIVEEENRSTCRNDKGKNGQDKEMKNASILNSSSILTGVSHELRTFMNAIVGFSSLLKDKDFTENEREEFSDHVIYASKQLVALFDSFINLANIEMGNLKVSISSCELNKILDELKCEFNQILKNEDYKNIVLEIETPSQNMKEIYIDMSKISKIIRSLFHNALNNTKSGYIRIGYSFYDGAVTFHVFDTGHGYFKNEEFLYSVNLNESMEKYNDTSSAINIILAKRTTQMLGGSIWLYCNGLFGTGIYFSIPLKCVEDIKPNDRDYLVMKKGITL
jgi:K+-sensing histidine kinase KdpD